MTAQFVSADSIMEVAIVAENNNSISIEFAISENGENQIQQTICISPTDWIKLVRFIDSEIEEYENKTTK